MTYIEAIEALMPCKCGSNNLLIRSIYDGSIYIHCHACKRETKNVHVELENAVKEWNNESIKRPMD